jgi:hypothetical protein
VTTLQGDDFISELEPLRAMGDQEDRAAVRRREDVPDERVGRLGIEVRGRLVEEQDRRV